MASIFQHLQPKGSRAITPQAPQIRKEGSKPVNSRASLLPSAVIVQRRENASNGRNSPMNGKASRKSDKLLPRTALKSGSSKPTGRKRPSPAQKPLTSSAESSDTEDSFDARKRAKISVSTEPDLKRKVRSLEAFSPEQDAFQMVHAADIASLDKATKFRSAFEEPSVLANVSLQYPSASQRERFHLVVPREKDDFKPLEDIIQVVEHVSQNYLLEEQAIPFQNDTNGIQRRLKRACARLSGGEFRKAVEDYNETMEKLRLDGTLAKNLDSLHSLNLPLVERILTQTYSRTVSPRVESLRQYENGTDNVYGELLPRFISTIFKETKLKSDQIFVDLGSGVGNVVLQAALEIGCDSWGCEMMQNACDLAELQQAEFKARCRLWGLACGEIHLERGDFLKNQKIGEILRKADVVLVNNQAFTPELNNGLVHLFLDLKEGCQIASLKSFVPAGHKIQARNLYSPVNVLSVKEKIYWSDSVSWTDAAGTYYIAKKDSSRLEAFEDKL